MNVCTDQLAMLLAGEGQLYSVSYLAGQADTSVLADRASRYVINYGRAEEIFLMHPDLVLAGSSSTRATVGMLKRLGFRVEVFAPENSFADIRTSILRVGLLLGKQAEARVMVAKFDDEVARIAAGHPAVRPLAALYYANSYTSGSGTLAADVVAHAGLANLGSKLGLAGTVKLPLELLVTGRPDLVVTARRPGAARSLATSILDHPALRVVGRQSREAVIPDRYWICGLPFTLEAVRGLVAAAGSIDVGRGR
ncbi:MAG: ABC transporter substrate-binding protein [Hyphomicrobiaceae bacterium]